MKKELLAMFEEPDTKEAVEHADENGKEFLVSPGGRKYAIDSGIVRFLQQNELTGNNQRYQKLYDRLAPVYDLTTKIYAFLKTGSEKNRTMEYLNILDVKDGDKVIEISIGTGTGLLLRACTAGTVLYNGKQNWTGISQAQHPAHKRYDTVAYNMCSCYDDSNKTIRYSNIQEAGCMVIGGGQAKYRTAGRPRSAKSHQAILRAALELFAEEGFRGMSMEAVAGRAGVGKTTIYRRWKSKEDLILDALKSELGSEAHFRDNSNLRADLIMALEQIMKTFAENPLVEKLMFRLFGEAKAHPSLLQVLSARYFVPHMKDEGTFFEQAKARGELPADIDLLFFSSMLVGPLYFYFLVSGVLPGCDLPSDLPQRIVDAIFRGIGAGSPVSPTPDMVDAAGITTGPWDAKRPSEEPTRGGQNGE